MSDEVIGADDLGRHFVPRLREGVAVVPVADEAVLYEEDNGRLHQLNATGFAVCSLIDGRTSLERAIEVLSSEVGLAPPAIESDVIEMVRDLGRKGLLAGVRKAGAEVGVDR